MVKTCNNNDKPQSQNGGMDVRVVKREGQKDVMGNIRKDQKQDLHRTSVEEPHIRRRPQTFLISSIEVRGGVGEERRDKTNIIRKTKGSLMSNSKE